MTQAADKDDVTYLIMDQHAQLRAGFARLDDAKDNAELAAIWGPLAALLEVHAAAEEEVFYPALLKKGADAEEETDDAIDDHNKIRDAVKEAEGHDVGSSAWFDAVGKARTENSKHIAEEEREALPDFRKHADLELRQELGRRFAEFSREHEGAKDLPAKDKDPDTYIAEHS